MGSAASKRTMQLKIAVFSIFQSDVENIGSFC
jgi:hypothetical protein